MAFISYNFKNVANIERKLANASKILDAVAQMAGCARRLREQFRKSAYNLGL